MINSIVLWLSGHYEVSAMVISPSILTRCLLTAAIHTLLSKSTEGTCADLSNVVHYSQLLTDPQDFYGLEPFH